MKRRKVGNSQSQHMFTRTARKVHPKNALGSVMRGGIRF